MGETAPQTKPQTATAIPAVGSLKDPERLERMWSMKPPARRAAAETGQFTLGEMLRWAARAPHEVPLVDGEFFFIAALAE